jgi:hypothetical protein
VGSQIEKQRENLHQRQESRRPSQSPASRLNLFSPVKGVSSENLSITLGTSLRNKFFTKLNPIHEDKSPLETYSDFLVSAKASPFG